MSRDTKGRTIGKNIGTMPGMGQAKKMMEGARSFALGGTGGFKMGPALSDETKISETIAQALADKLQTEKSPIFSDNNSRLSRLSQDTLTSEFKFTKQFKPGFEFVGPDDTVDLRKNPELHMLSKLDLFQLTGKEDRSQYNAKDMRVIEAALRIRKIVANSQLSQEGKKAAAEALYAFANRQARAFGEDSIGNLKTLQAEYERIEAALMPQERNIQALVDMEKLFAEPLRMQKPTGSVLYKAHESFVKGDILFPMLTSESAQALKHGQEHMLAAGYQSFVIEHNWAGAFANATDFDAGEFHLPFEFCAFEFQINDMRLIWAMIENLSESGDTVGIPVIQTSVGWAIPFMTRFINGQFVADQESDAGRIASINGNALVKLCAAQIRAVSIALEAKVAERNVVRAPYKLNRQREAKGKPPLLDYHVVSLARRTGRPERLPQDHIRGTHASPRFHLRRGHWRHYDNHKIWLEWTLVGDPDLGFIDKHYRL